MKKMPFIDDGFIDAQEMHKKHPETFEAPTDDELSCIKAGDSVKVCRNNERFWVTITKVDCGNIEGIIDNQLICNSVLKCGDHVRFKKKNIYTIWN